MPAYSIASSAPNFDAIFHATSIDLLVPTWSAIPPSTDAAGWWEGVQAAPLRQISFLDEKLFYAVGLHVPDDVFASSSTSSSSSEPPSELLRFLSRLQLTMTTTLLPPMTSRPPSLTVSATPNPNASGLNGDNLFVPKTPHMPHTPDTSGPPVTPNPFPRMDQAEEQYAGVEGVVVWEGPVAELEIKDGRDVKASTDGPGSNGGVESRDGGLEGKGGRVILRGENGWEVIYKGQVPVAYVRTQIQNPVLGLTASVTLRDAPIKGKKAGHNAETSSVYSAADTVRTDGTEEADGMDDDEEDDLAGMEEIDLLGGLGDERMPTSRLASSIRQDLSLPSVLPNSAPATAITPYTAPQPPTASTAPPSTSGPSRERFAAAPTLNLVQSNHTLRKSYRRILSLSSGLRIRMRTLFLPQLLPPRSANSASHEEDEGERRVALCVEVENPHEGQSLPFEVENITVDVGGKGGKVSAELLCQPETYRGGEVFPLVLDPVEQYNLLYGVSIASTSEDRNGAQSEADENMARAMGKGDEQRPVAITVLGRPYSTTNGAKVYPTERFSSRWNCTLDLAPFYAASSAALEHRQMAPPLPRSSGMKAQSSAPAPNAIVGDKRFSIASLAQNAMGTGRPGSLRMPIGHGTGPGQRPGNLQGSRVNSMRGPIAQVQGHGLLVSVKILPQRDDGPDSAGSSVNVLDSFSLEVFVQNRTDEVRRFRVGVPPREGHRGVREVWEKRRRRREEEPEWGMDDPVLRQMLAANLASAPALVPLEDDVRCGPLLPGASMSARLRFLALREGVHTLERLRVTGANGEFDFVLSPVLDVVVRSATGEPLS